jgi:hypothetical protein
MNKKGLLFNPIDLIAGVLLVAAGTLTIVGMGNLGAVIAGIGLVIEGIKVAIQMGL